MSVTAGGNRISLIVSVTHTNPTVVAFSASHFHALGLKHKQKRSCNDKSLIFGCWHWAEQIVLNQAPT